MRVLQNTLLGAVARVCMWPSGASGSGEISSRSSRSLRVVGVVIALVAAALLSFSPPFSFSSSSSLEAQAQETWVVGPGKSLRGHLEEWASRAGWTLVWEEETYDINLSAGVALTGSFEQAIVTLLEGIPAADAIMYRGNKTLVVTVKGSAEQ
ncbi:MAG: toxin co-regulated pilus biosynthesis Q family protein [Alphaproteobacteria bacterium]